MYKLSSTCNNSNNTIYSEMVELIRSRRADRMTLPQVRSVPRHYYNHVEYTSIPFFMCLFLFLGISSIILYPYISPYLSFFSVPFSYLTVYSGYTDNIPNLYVELMLCRRLTFWETYDIVWAINSELSQFEVLQIFYYQMDTCWDIYRICFFFCFLFFVGYFIVLDDALRCEIDFFARSLSNAHSVYEQLDYTDYVGDLLLYAHCESGYVDYEEFFFTWLFFFRHGYDKAIFFTDINVSTTTSPEEYLYWSTCLYTHYSSCCVGMITYMEWSLLFVEFTSNATYFSDCEARSILEDTFQKFFLGASVRPDIFEDSRYDKYSDYFKVEFYVSSCITLICAVIPYTIWVLEAGFFSFWYSGAYAFYFEDLAGFSPKWFLVEDITGWVKNTSITEKYFWNVHSYPILEGVSSYMSNLEGSQCIDVAVLYLIDIDTKYGMFKWSTAFSEETESIVDNFWFSYLRLSFDIAPHSVLKSYLYVSNIDDIECSLITDSCPDFSIDTSVCVADHSLYLSLLSDTLLVDTEFANMKERSIQNWYITSDECADSSLRQLKKDMPMDVELYTYLDALESEELSTDFAVFYILEDYLFWTSNLEFDWVDDFTQQILFTDIDEIYDCVSEHRLRVAGIKSSITEYVLSLEDLDDVFEYYFSDSEYANQFKPYYVGLLNPMDSLAEIDLYETYEHYFTHADFTYRNINYLGYMDLYPSVESVLFTFNLSLIEYISDKYNKYDIAVKFICSMYIYETFDHFTRSLNTEAYYYFNSWYSQTNFQFELIWGFDKYAEMMKSSATNGSVIFWLSASDERGSDWGAWEAGWTEMDRSYDRKNCSPLLDLQEYVPLFVHSVFISDYLLSSAFGDIDTEKNNFYLEWIQLLFMYNLLDFGYALLSAFLVLSDDDDVLRPLECVAILSTLYFVLYSFLYTLYMAASLVQNESLFSKLLFLKNFNTEGYSRRNSLEFNLSFFYFSTFLATWLIVTCIWLFFCGFTILNAYGWFGHFVYFISPVWFNLIGTYYNSLHTYPVVFFRSTSPVLQRFIGGRMAETNFSVTTGRCYIAQYIPFSNTYKVYYCEVTISCSYPRYVIPLPIMENRYVPISGIYSSFDIYGVACYQLKTKASFYDNAFEQWDSAALDQYIDDTSEIKVPFYKSVIARSSDKYISFESGFMFWYIGLLGSISIMFHPFIIARIHDDILRVVDWVYSFFAIFPTSISLFFIISIASLIFIHVLDYWSTCLSLESSYTGCYSKKTESALITAFLIFLISESVLFCAFIVSFMWYSFHTSTFAAFLRSTGLETEFYSIVPICSTAALVSSGYCYNYSFYLLLSNNLERSFKYVTVTVLLGYVFIVFQLYEYFVLPFTMSDGAFGSIFYLITGFHGLHVVIGVALIIFLFYIIRDSVISDRRCSLYIMSIAYWHFVDIIWFIVYCLFYSFGDPVEYFLLSIFWAIFLFFAISPPFEYIWSYFNPEDIATTEQTTKENVQTEDVPFTHRTL